MPEYRGSNVTEYPFQTSPRVWDGEGHGGMSLLSERGHPCQPEAMETFGSCERSK